MKDFLRTSLSRAAFPICLLAVFSAGVAAHDDFFQKTYCMVARPLMSNTDGFEGFRDCSNVRQSVDLGASTNIRDSASESEGWRVYTADDPSRPGILQVTVIKDRSDLVFYPRLQGQDAFISVDTPENNTVNRLFLLKSAGESWTPISRQYNLNLFCADHGWLKKFFPLRLTVILNGRSSQLWHRNGQIFF